MRLARRHPAPPAVMTAGQLFGVAFVISAVLFGLAGVIGSAGYLVSVTRRQP